MTLTTTRLRRKALPLCCLCLAAALTFTASVIATAEETPAPAQNPVKVFHLANVAQTSEAVSIVSALRNMLDPHDRVYLAEETNDVLVTAPADQVALAGRLISELDRPKQTYRVIYTVAEFDGSKRLGVQHFAMVVVTGQRITLKQGDKVPVLTGSFTKDNAAQQTEFTYLDVGINLDTTLDQFANGLRLRSKVEQSSVAEPQGATIGQDPIVRQSVLQGTSVIVPGKPLTLGSIDIVGSTRRLDIEVVAEPLS